MDPITAASLASSIITFIDFGYKLVAGGVEVYRSVDGTSSHNADVQHSLDRLDKIYTALTHSRPQASGTEHELSKLATECAKTTTELSSALKELVAKPHSIKSTISKSLKSILKADEIKKLEERLERMSRDFQKIMTAVLLDRQSSMYKYLEGISNDQRRLGLQTQNDIVDLRKSLIDLVESKSESLDVRMQNLQNMSQGVHDLLHRGVQAADQNQILKSLQFPNMRERRNNIEDSHEGTFEWMFDSEHENMQVGFTDWLRTGNGIYWISGQAGSGKSTLLKYVYGHSTTLSLLSDWAADRKLVTTSFFFWNAGSKMEKSQEGFLRSLLFEILRQCPELISHIHRERDIDHHWTVLDTSFAESSWSRAELLRIFKTLAFDSATSRKFCLFIDGLDEFAGNKFEIAELISKLASWSNVKICVSSRPYPEFQNLFGENKRSLLILSEHTRRDVLLYAAENLGLKLAFHDCEPYDIRQCDTNGSRSDLTLDIDNYPKCSITSTTDARYHILLKVICERAEGVFLWVSLVIKELKQSLHKGYDLDELQEQLHRFPRDLRVHFDRMLDSIEEDDWQSCAEILIMCTEFSEIPPMLAFQSVLPLPAKSLQYQQILEWQKSVALRIKARCGDFIQLLNLNDDPDDPSSELHWKVASFHDLLFRLPHKTMSDYLMDPRIRNKLYDHARKNFDPIRGICNSLTSRLEDLTCLDVNWFLFIVRYIGDIAVKRPSDHSLFEIYDTAQVLVLEILKSLWTEREHHFSKQSGRSLERFKMRDIYSTASAFCIVDYLEYTIQRDPSLVNRNEWYQAPLLVTCLESTHTTRNFGGDVPDLVDLLLLHGADPNARHQYLCDVTSWKHLVQDVFWYPLKIAEDEPSDPNMHGLARIMTSMIRGGADVDILLKKSPDHYSILTEEFDSAPLGANQSQPMISLDKATYSILPLEDAIRIEQLILEERRKRAHRHVSTRAQWLGWE